MDYSKMQGTPPAGKTTGADIIQMPVIARNTARTAAPAAPPTTAPTAPGGAGALSGAADGMRQTTRPINQVSAYWHALRAGRLVPSRSDVDPRGIEDVLRYCFIVERIARGHARIRIAGTHIGDIMGMEVRGMPLSALFEPAARAGLQSSLAALFEGPVIQHLDLRANARIGKPRLDARLALFPLRDDQFEVTRALGCLHAAGPIGRAPRRFNITGGIKEPLQSEGAEVPDKTAPADLGSQSAGVPAGLEGFSQPQTLFHGREQDQFKETAVPYLRVLASDDA